MNPPECVWETLNLLFTKTILQEKVRIHDSIINLVHKFIPMPQAMKIPAAESSRGQGMGKIGEKFRRGT